MNIQKIKKIRSLEELNASEIADFIAYLIKHELNPGGPYLLTKFLKENVNLNAKIYILFAKKGKDLPNLKQYIDILKDNLDNELLKQLDEFSKPKQDAKYDQLIHKRIFNDIDKILIQDLKHIGIDIFQKIQKVDFNGEITQIHKALIESIDNKANLLVSKSAISLYGRANFYTWMAYSLYDDIIDERNNFAKLCVANIFHREAFNSYLKAGVSYDLLSNVFNEVDNANALELTYCRFKIIKNEIIITDLPSMKFLNKLLGEKSIAHCVGIFQILKNSHPTESLEIVMKQYCAARQLNDDIHDWEEDLRKGHVTYANAWLINCLGIKTGTYNVDALIKQLRKIFWQKGLSELLKEVNNMAKTAEEGFQKLKIYQDSSFNSISILPIINSSKKASEELFNTKIFLENVNFN